MHRPTDTDHTLIEEALHAARDTKSLFIGEELLKQSAKLFGSQFGAVPAAIVADANTFAVAGRAVVDSFKSTGHPCVEPFVFTDPDLYAEHRFAAELEESLRRHDAIPIAVGSGTINDLTKLTAHRVGRPYMSIATAASMDGYTAFGASITHEGSKQTFDCPAPRAVMADLDVIAAAPDGMNAWGYADLLAKITAGADWIVADELGVEPIDPRAWRMVQQRLRAWTGDPDGVKRGDREAIRSLICGLMMSGFAMQATCSSRPASGAEHQFSHLWDMHHHTHEGKSPSHGAKVGVAMVAVAQLYEALLSRSMESMDIDAIVNRWLDLAEEERRIDELFHRDTGLRPVRSDSPVSEAHFIAIALAEKGKLETRAKHPTRAQLREQLEVLQRCWPLLCKRVSQHLLPAHELADMLNAAGAPSRPAQIGISPARMRLSFRQAYQIRRRFTVLDLAVRSDTLNACLDVMEGLNGDA